MDLRLRLTLVAKAALCGALFLTSFCIAPEALSMVILLSLEQTYFLCQGTILLWAGQTATGHSCAQEWLTLRRVTQGRISALPVPGM